MSEFGNLEIEKGLNKKTISRIGWALAGLTFFSQVGAGILIAICTMLFPELTEVSIYAFIVGTLPIYFIGFPIFLLIIRKVPKETINEKSKLTILQLIKFIIISFAVLYVFNILGMGINWGISVLKGSDVLNPLENLLSKVNVFETAFFVALLAPIMEEIIFRKVLLSRLRKFGDFFSIILSALAFGMFHGNLSQFFYAFALGCIFAYIVIKTGTIKYSIILHIIVNLFGTVIIPTIISKENNILNSIIGLFVIAMIISGIVLFIQNIKKVALDKGDFDLTKKQQFGLIFKNSGMIVYSILFVLSVIAVIFAV